MRSALTIREADAHDIPAIRELCERIWPDTYSSILQQDQLDYMMEWMYSTPSLTQQMEQGCRFLLLYKDHDPIGYASYQLLRDRHFKLHKLYVLPSLQRQGAGRCLLEFIHNKIKAQGGQSIELQVNRKNKARYFYEGMGYFIREEADIAVGNGYYMNDYIMVTELVY